MTGGKELCSRAVIIFLRLNKKKRRVPAEITAHPARTSGWEHLRGELGPGSGAAGEGWEKERAAKPRLATGSRESSQLCTQMTLWDATGEKQNKKTPPHKCLALGIRW